VRGHEEAAQQPHSFQTHFLLLHLQLHAEVGKYTGEKGAGNLVELVDEGVDVLRDLGAAAHVVVRAHQHLLQDLAQRSLDRATYAPQHLRHQHVRRGVVCLVVGQQRQ